MKRLEAATLLTGGLFLIIALTFVDWRLGLFVAGTFLVMSSLDLPRRRP